MERVARVSFWPSVNLIFEDILYISVSLSKQQTMRDFFLFIQFEVLMEWGTFCFGRLPIFFYHRYLILRSPHEFDIFVLFSLSKKMYFVLSVEKNYFNKI